MIADPSTSPGMSPMLRVEGVKKSFRRRAGLFFGTQDVVWAVAGIDGEGISLSIARGEILALVGESGSGKSTLGRIILGLVKPDEGSVSLDGTDVTGARGEMLFRLRSRMQMIFQDPYSSLNPRRTVAATVAQPLQLHSIVPRNRIGERVNELLDTVGLSPPSLFGARYPHQLSGGQRQRVAIARAIATNPGLLVADEPVASLDVSVRANILRVLAEMRQRLNLSILFVSHDLGVVRSIADRVAVMYLGRIVELGDAESVLTEPRHPYTQALLASAPIADPVAARLRDRGIVKGEIPPPTNPPSGCTFHPRCVYAFSECPVREPALLPTPRGVAACHLNDQRIVGDWSPLADFGELRRRIVPDG